MQKGRWNVVKKELKGLKAYFFLGAGAGAGKKRTGSATLVERNKQLAMLPVLLLLQIKINKIQFCIQGITNFKLLGRSLKHVIIPNLFFKDRLKFNGGQIQLVDNRSPHHWFAMDGYHLACVAEQNLANQFVYCK